jgi:hypothetical protein
MKKIFYLLFTVTAVLVGSDAFAGPLCTPPLYKQCVLPQWGELDPSGLDSNNANATGAGTTAAADTRTKMTSMGRVRMMTAAYGAPKHGKSVAPKVIVDDGKKFEPETTALIKAITRASFDKNGEVGEGKEAIVAAAEKLQRVSAGYQLNLYLKATRKLRPDDVVALGKKVGSVNDLLGAGSEGKGK